MSDAFVSWMYNQIEADNKAREYEYWHASSIAECPRTQYLKRLGVPPITQPTGAKILRWTAGHKIEEVVRPYLQKKFPDLQSNVRMTSEHYDLTGEYDNYSPEHQLIIEIKSISGRALKYKAVADDRHHLRDGKPYLNHLYQNHAYVLLLREQQLPVKEILFLYVTLDGLLVSYTEPVNLSINQSVVKRLKLLKDAWKKQVPPPCYCSDEAHPLYKSCMQFCDYKDPRTGECCSKKLIERSSNIEGVKQ